ncbi:hypothetical protein Hanom_Chr12g01107311 [Helianthus anomalus]
MEKKWMELTCQMRKTEPLDKSRKTDQTSGTKMAFYTRNKDQLGLTPLRV